MADYRLGLMEQRLVEHFAGGGTAEEAANEFGVSSAEAYQRVKDALARVDVWTEDELRKMNVITLQKLLAQASAAKDPSNPKSIEAIAKLVQAIEKLQSKSFDLKQGDMEKLIAMQASAMMSMIEQSYYRARALLVLEYPDVDVSKIDTHFQSSLAGLIESAK